MAGAIERSLSPEMTVLSDQCQGHNSVYR